MKALTFLLAIAILGWTLLSPAQAGEGQTSTIQLRAKLAGRTPQTWGEITFERGRADNRLKLWVEGLPGRKAEVHFPGLSVPLDVDSDGQALLLLNSRRGDRVPRLRRGDVVSVAFGGRTILRGSMAPL